MTRGVIAIESDVARCGREGGSEVSPPLPCAWLVLVRGVWGVAGGGRGRSESHSSVAPTTGSAGAAEVGSSWGGGRLLDLAGGWMSAEGRRLAAGCRGP